MSLSINAAPYRSLHFAGIFGSGMSALAQYCVWEKCPVSGSDRLLDSSDVADIQERLAALGCALFPQDGSGINAATEAVVVSTAIEESNPDIMQARKRRLPVFHRSDVLNAIIDTKKTIAVAGTSGKSTVTAMVFEFLSACGRSPSLISGANLMCLQEQNLIGNAFRGSSDVLVIEADESDGTCAKYRPNVSVFLNVSKDHKPVEDTMGIFKELASHSTTVITNADDRSLDILKPSLTFGIESSAAYMPDRILSVAPTVSFVRNGLTYSLPLPGIHNLSNALAALAVCGHAGCDEAALVKAVSSYKGVKRRFSITALSNGIRVIDDYAHNPDKIKAAVRAAHGLAGRVIAVFQPHGFGPTRFLKDELIAAFSDVLTKDDLLLILPIYYAGGTVQKDISSGELVSQLRSRQRTAFAPKDRSECISLIKKNARAHDAVLVMGARDPSLSAFVKDIGEMLEKA